MQSWVANQTIAVAVIIDICMTSCDVKVGIHMTSPPVLRQTFVYPTLLQCYLQICFRTKIANTLKSAIWTEVLLTYLLLPWKVCALYYCSTPMHDMVLSEGNNISTAILMLQRFHVVIIYWLRQLFSSNKHILLQRCYALTPFFPWVFLLISTTIWELLFPATEIGCSLRPLTYPNLKLG